jgi:hypothetical protein
MGGSLVSSHDPCRRCPHIRKPRRVVTCSFAMICAVLISFSKMSLAWLLSTRKAASTRLRLRWNGNCIQSRSSVCTVNGYAELLSPRDQRLDSCCVSTSRFSSALSVDTKEAMIASSHILETDPRAWASYHKIMNELMQDDRVLPETTRRANAKWRKKNMSNGNSTLPALDPEILFVQSYLVSNSLWLEPKSILDLSSMGGPAAVRRALHQQHEEFRSLAGFSPETVTESLLYEYLLRCLTYMGDVCA